MEKTLQKQLKIQGYGNGRAITPTPVRTGTEKIIQSPIKSQKKMAIKAARDDLMMVKERPSQVHGLHEKQQSLEDGKIAVP